MDLQEEVVKHALTNTCAYMTTVGRFGWAKILPKYGWKKSKVVMQYDLEGIF